MPQKQHRDHYDIVRNILEVVNNDNVEPQFRNSMNKTKVGYAAGLTYFQISDYLKELIDIRLLEMIDFKPYPYYEITEKGRRCLELISTLFADLSVESS
jgi:predicted transcriptional regulator